MDSASDNIVQLENIDSKCDGTLGDSVVEDTESTFDFDFSENTSKEDLTLIVEGKKLFVNKIILAVASPVFCRIFEADFKEKSQDEIELPGKKHADVLEFLRCFYPNVMKVVTEKTFMQVFPLADEYQMDSLKTNCVKCLISTVNNNTSADDLLKYLTQACRYRLVQLKEKCIVLLAEKNLDELEGVKEQDDVSKEAQYELLVNIANKQRDALKDAEQNIKRLREVNETEHHKHKYALSWLPKSDVSKMKEFEKAKGAGISFTFDATKLEQTHLSVKSPLVSCKGFEWQVEIQRKYNNQYTCMLYIELRCKSQDFSGTCDVTSRVVLVNIFSSKQNNLSVSLDHTFSKGSKVTGVNIISFKDLINDMNGYVIDGQANIEVFLLVK